MLEEQEEIQISVNKLIEMLYEMFLKDLKIGNINKENIKSYGKIINKRNVFNNHDEPTLFDHSK